MILAETQFKCINKFYKLLDESTDLLAKTENSGALELSEIQRLYEVSYLRMFIAFEGFIESCFLCYLMGKKSNLGYRPKLKIKFESVDECFNWIWGKKIQKRDYIDWSDLNFVKEKSILFWASDSTPFTKLLNDSPHYKHMKKLRNSIVHLTQYHNDTLKELEQHFLTSVSNRTAGEILKTDYSFTNKALIYFLKEELKKYAQITIIDPDK